MSKRLLALNLLLAVAAIVLAAQLAQVLSAPRPLPSPPAPSDFPSAGSTKEEPAPSRPLLAAYNVVATRNLFNPSRSEVAAPSAPIAQAAKPLLYGVVIDGDIRRAYLQDPATKRVFGYKIGDMVAGGQLEQIEEDRVVIKRPDGPLEVMLRDPSKPKPVVSAPTSPPVGARPSVVPSGPSIIQSTPETPLPVPPASPPGVPAPSR